jgi:hypothetical protein
LVGDLLPVEIIKVVFPHRLSKTFRPHPSPLLTAEPAAGRRADPAQESQDADAAPCCCRSSRECRWLALCRPTAPGRHLSGRGGQSARGSVPRCCRPQLGRRFLPQRPRLGYPNRAAGHRPGTDQLASFLIVISPVFIVHYKIMLLCGLRKIPFRLVPLLLSHVHSLTLNRCLRTVLCPSSVLGGTPLGIPQRVRLLRPTSHHSASYHYDRRLRGL